MKQLRIYIIQHASKNDDFLFPVLQPQPADMSSFHVSRPSRADGSWLPPRFKSPIMRLDVFLDEDIPEFPFAKTQDVPSCRASTGPFS